MIENNKNINGFVFIDKEIDWTSRDVCNKVSKLFHTKKVGHSGTLDPFATGLLVVAIGKASKCLSFLENMNKSYIAELSLGVETTTGDSSGEIKSKKEVNELSKEEIKEVLKSFLGKQTQIPPMTSAIHINGRKLYDLAHQGIEVDRPAREIEIMDISLLDYSDNKIIFFSQVSKGTYIRVLGEDIAKKLNTVGHLSNLKRTKISSFSVTNAKKVSSLSEKDIIPIKTLLKDTMDIIYVSDDIIKRVKNGMDISKDFVKNTKSHYICFVEKDNDNELAIYEKTGTFYHCVRGLNNENN